VVNVIRINPQLNKTKNKQWQRKEKQKENQLKESRLKEEEKENN